MGSSNKMTDWLEILTGLAVLAGIVLLIQEISLNTQAVNRQAAVDRAAVISTPFFESGVMRAADEKIRQVDGRGQNVTALMERYDMTAEEALVWSRHLTQLLRVLQSDYDNGEPELALSYAYRLLSNPDVRVALNSSIDLDSEWGEQLRAIAEEIEAAEKD